MAKRKIKIILRPLARAWGYANDAARTIELDSRMDDLTMLSTAAHEVLHIVYPFLTEEAVTEGGDEIGLVLHRLGFRRADHGDEH